MLTFNLNPQNTAMKLLIVSAVVLLSSFTPVTTNGEKQFESNHVSAFKSPFWPTSKGSVKLFGGNWSGSLSVLYPSLVTMWEWPLSDGGTSPGGQDAIMRVYGSDPFNPDLIEIGFQLGGGGSAVSITQVVYNEFGENSIQVWGNIGSADVYYKAKFTLANPGYAQLTGRYND